MTAVAGLRALLTPFDRASIQWSLTGSVTVQRTQEDGSPLPGS